MWQLETNLLLKPSNQPLDYIYNNYNYDSQNLTNFSINFVHSLLTIESFSHLFLGPDHVVQQYITIVDRMGVGLLSTEVLQLPSQQLLEDIKALGVHCELRHLFNNLL